jgi:aerobic-type carbon monoxide dehydrogenase small subunit (CoxS/CutS family)
MADRNGLTRRALFRGISSATVVAGCSRNPGKDESTPPTVTDALAPGEIGPDAATLEFTLDGQRVSVSVEPRTTLLEALRVDLDKTGTKVVCDRGACSACTVLVGGVPRNSCMMLAHDVAGQEVTTVEGLAKDGTLTVLQEKFVEHDALQCGFCTSGMLMSSAALLKRSKGNLERAEVEDAISGNLCRCGTYPHVVAAVLDAAGKRGA